MSSNIKDIVPKEIFDIWSAYLAQNEKGLKKQASLLLYKFIKRAQTLDYDLLQDVVYHLTDKHRCEKMKIDFRLFERVIFPVLVKEIKLKKATANRRLAQFDQFLLASNPLFEDVKEQLDYTNDYFEPADFYQKEIEFNTKDQIAIEGLLYRIASQLNYATHELPEYGLVVDASYFKTQLIRFKTALELSSKKGIWSNRIEHWEFALKTWTAYLKTENDTYQDYLNHNKLIFIG